MPEIKHKSRPTYSDNHDETGNGTNKLNLKREIIDADTYQKLHIPSRTPSPILDADGLQIEQHTIQPKPCTDIIYA